MSAKCGCGNDHYSTDGVAVQHDGVSYDGPRLCSYDQYRTCKTPDLCHGNLINGHCAHDTNFTPKAKLHWAAPMMDGVPDPPANIEAKGKGGVVLFHRRGEEEIWSSPYCAVNRGHCAIMDSESGEACAGVGFCIWRLASETFNPWAVDLCMQNTDNIITDAPAQGSHSPNYHEDANRYKETLPKKPEPVAETSEPSMKGQNLEEIMVVSGHLDKITREASDLMHTQKDEDEDNETRLVMGRRRPKFVDSLLPHDSQERKELPLFDFLRTYFPRAFVELARFSKVANDKHNPGERMHWSKGKSQDHLNCVQRHLFEVGAKDEFGFWHDVALFWRAGANLEMRLEAEALGISYDELLRQYREEERK
jgi:hypothetical protein